MPRPKPDEEMVMRSIRIPVSLAEAIHVVADSERRSDNNMLTVLVEEALAARGVGVKAPPPQLKAVKTPRE